MLDFRWGVENQLVTPGLRRQLLVVALAAAGLFALPSSADSYSFGPTVEVLSGEVAQFDADKQACDASFPDSPARAFRDDLGRIQINISQGKPPLVKRSGEVTNRGNRRLIGPTLKSAVAEQLAPGGRYCAGNVTHTNPYMPVFQVGAPQPAAAWPPPPEYSPGNPANFHGREWVSATWTTDGRTVYALLHNEYHGWEDLDGDGSAPDDCAGVSPSEFKEKCFYGSVTTAKSTNGGAVYGTSQTSPKWLHIDSPFYSAPPDHLVFSSSYKYVAGAGKQGIQDPTNIFQKVPTDGYYYVMFRIDLDGIPAAKAGLCLARTQDLDLPSAWRGWDGSAFTVSFVNPYVSLDPPENHLCQPISRATLGGFPARNVTYNTYLRKYMLLAMDRRFDPARNEDVSGIYYSLSDDLMSWSEPVLMMEAPSYAEKLGLTCADPDPVAYPSILDEDDPAASTTSSERNFYQPDRAAYVYFVRYNRNHAVAGCPLISDDRDLVRVLISFAPASN